MRSRGQEGGILEIARSFKQQEQLEDRKKSTRDSATSNEVLRKSWSASGKNLYTGVEGKMFVTFFDAGGGGKRREEPLTVSSEGVGNRLQGFFHFERRSPKKRRYPMRTEKRRGEN